jgi:hypothetical protein
VRTFFWCLAVVASYCAGHYSVRSHWQMGYWRQLQASRNIQSQARREAASVGLRLFLTTVLFLLATVAFGLLATFGVAS